MRKKTKNRNKNNNKQTNTNEQYRYNAIEQIIWHGNETKRTNIVIIKKREDVKIRILEY